MNCCCTYMCDCADYDEPINETTHPKLTKLVKDYNERLLLVRDRVTANPKLCVHLEGPCKQAAYELAEYLVSELGLRL